MERHQRGHEIAQAQESLSGLSTDQYVTVRPGENIWAIAAAHYGGRHHLAAIYEANHLWPEIRSEHGKRAFVAPVIHPGQQLLLPSEYKVKALEAAFFRALESGARESAAMPARQNIGYPVVSMPDGEQSFAPWRDNPLAPVPAWKQAPKTWRPPGPDCGAAVYSSVTADFSSPPGDPRSDTTTKGGGAEVVSPPDALESALPRGKEVQPSQYDADPVTGGASMSSKSVALSLWARAAQVCEVIAESVTVGAIKEGVKEAVYDPLGTIGRATTATAVGIGLGLATRGAGLVAEGAALAGMGLGAVAACDFLNPFSKKNQSRNTAICRDIQLAWNANDDKTLIAAADDLERCLGGPVFDLALSAASGYGGSRLAGVLRPGPGNLWRPGWWSGGSGSIKPGPGSGDSGGGSIIDVPVIGTTADPIAILPSLKRLPGPNTKPYGVAGLIGCGPSGGRAIVPPPDCLQVPPKQLAE